MTRLTMLLICCVSLFAQTAAFTNAAARPAAPGETIAGQNGKVVFSGLGVPTGAPSGSQDLVLSGGGPSNAVKIQIQ